VTINVTESDELEDLKCLKEYVDLVNEDDNNAVLGQSSVFQRDGNDVNEKKTERKNSGVTKDGAISLFEKGRDEPRDVDVTTSSKTMDGETNVTTTTSDQQQQEKYPHGEKMDAVVTNDNDMATRAETSLSSSRHNDDLAVIPFGEGNPADSMISALAIEAVAAGFRNEATVKKLQPPAAVGVTTTNPMTKNNLKNPQYWLWDAFFAGDDDNGITRTEKTRTASKSDNKILQSYPPSSSSSSDYLSRAKRVAGNDAQEYFQSALDGIFELNMSGATTTMMTPPLEHNDFINCGGNGDNEGVRDGGEYGELNRLIASVLGNETLTTTTSTLCSAAAEMTDLEGGSSVSPPSNSSRGTTVSIDHEDDTTRTNSYRFPDNNTFLPPIQSSSSSTNSGSSSFQLLQEEAAIHGREMRQLTRNMAQLRKYLRDDHDRWETALTERLEESQRELNVAVRKIMECQKSVANTEGKVRGLSIAGTRPRPPEPVAALQLLPMPSGYEVVPGENGTSDEAAAAAGVMSEAQFAAIQSRISSTASILDDDNNNNKFTIRIILGMPPDDDAQQPVRLSANQETKLQSIIRNENETRKVRHTALLNEYDCKALLYKDFF